MFLNDIFLGVVEFLSKGAISKDHPDLKSFREESCLSCLSSDLKDQRNFTHSLRLDSAVDTLVLKFFCLIIYLLF